MPESDQDIFYHIKILWDRKLLIILLSVLAAVSAAVFMFLRTPGSYIEAVIQPACAVRVEEEGLTKLYYPEELITTASKIKNQLYRDCIAAAAGDQDLASPSLSVNMVGNTQYYIKVVLMDKTFAAGKKYFDLLLECIKKDVEPTLELYALALQERISRNRTELAAAGSDARTELIQNRIVRLEQEKKLLQSTRYVSEPQFIFERENTNKIAVILSAGILSIFLVSLAILFFEYIKTDTEK